MVTLWLKESDDKMLGVILRSAEVELEDGNVSVVIDMRDCEDLLYALTVVTDDCDDEVN